MRPSRVVSQLARWSGASKLLPVSMLLSAIGICVMAASGAATIRYVEPDGGGDYGSIQHAINVSSPGDTIELGDGVYAGSSDARIYTDIPLSFRSRNGFPGQCIVDGQNNSSNIWNAETAINLDGITFQHYPTVAVNVSRNYGIRPMSVRDCVFRQNSGTALLIIGADPVLVADSRFVDNFGLALVVAVQAAASIDGCWFENTHGETDQVPGGALFIAGESEPVQVVDCTFVHNTDSRGGVLGIYGANTQVDFTGCTFFENSASLTGSIAHMDAPNSQTVSFDRCIVYGSMGSELVGPCQLPGSVSMTCSISYANEYGDFPGCLADDEFGYDNVSADPLFCDPGNGDFSIRDDSPAAPNTPPNESCDRAGAQPVGCSVADVLPPGLSEDSRITVIPNPAVAEVVLRISDPSILPADVTVDLMSADGRKIRRLSAHPGVSGGIEVVWDGKDASSRNLPAGIYFARVHLGTDASTVRLVRLGS